MGEHLPYKQGVVGSNPTQPISCEIYQRLDCRPHKPNVVGSSPTLAICTHQRRFAFASENNDEELRWVDVCLYPSGMDSWSSG